MSGIDWKKELGWTEEHLEDLRMAGYAYIQQGKYEIARSFFQALVVLDQNNVYDAQTLGAIYLQLNQPTKSIYYLDRALKLDADHSPTLLNLCKALFMLGKVEDGLRLANVLKNDPRDDIANVAKALIMAYG